eukprot:3584862-Amphidinium_carterae.1
MPTSKCLIALIVRMPLSGRVPLKRFVCIKNSFMARIIWTPIPGSAPSKPFIKIAKVLTALIAQMPFCDAAQHLTKTWNDMLQDLERKPLASLFFLRDVQTTNLITSTTHCKPN